MIKAVFFDLDDTLFDQSFCSREALKKLKSNFEFLINKPLDELWKLHNELLNDVHKEYVLSGKLDIEHARMIRFRKLYEKMNVNFTEDDVKASAELYRKNYLDNRILVEGAKELLDELEKKYKLGIISNNQHQEQIDKLIYLNILDHFFKVITSEIAGCKKPDKMIFEFALKEFDVTADEAILIGDDWESDILGAVNCGIKTIWLNRNMLEKPEEINISEINSFVPIENVFKLL